MKNLLFAVLLTFALALPAGATEISAPVVPESGQSFMPAETEDFGGGLAELLEKALLAVNPELKTCVRSCAGILLTALLLTAVTVLWEQSARGAAAAASAAILVLLFRNTDTLIALASDTLQELCQYGKLLCLVMTTALAAQGAAASSAALYTGTAVFSALLGSLMDRFFVPLVYVFVIFSAAGSALGEEALRKLAETIKSLLCWLLKTLLIVYTTYMSVTGVIAGTTDAAALKAAKVTISTAVPVVGGILSDASEAVLVSMGLLKNAAGIYGILATLAVFIGPFLKVGIQYLGLKITAGLSSLFASKPISSLIGDASSAMGLLLGMLAAACTMVLVSTVCFLKGAV